MNTRGRQRELAVIALLRDAAFIAYRAAHGPADVIALRHDHQPMLIQVKSTAGGPYERFTPHERRDLLNAAHQAGAAAVLAWWPPRRRVPEWIDSTDWPAFKETA